MLHLLPEQAVSPSARWGDGTQIVAARNVGSAHRRDDDTKAEAASRRQPAESVSKDHHRAHIQENESEASN